MRQWEVYLYPFAKERPHPVVVLPPQERCENPDLVEVNALLCVSIRADRPLRKTEVALDRADWLDWPTAVRCDLILLLRKANFLDQRGCVTRLRRSAITRKIIESLRLPQ